MRIFRLLATTAGLGVILPALALAQQSQPHLPAQASTADHSKFEILQKEFTSGPEVTEACLSCHTEASDQVHMHSIHFSWNYDHPETGQKLGKRNVINSFCGSVAGNEPRCTSCHAGYGWEDMNQDPPQEANAVDCHKRFVGTRATEFSITASTSCNGFCDERGLPLPAAFSCQSYGRRR